MSSLDSSEADIGDAQSGLVGLLAYGELSAFERMAAEASLAPGFAERIRLLDGAATRVQRHRSLVLLLEQESLDPVEVMARHRAPVDEYHRHTTPRTWAESLVKAWAWDGLVCDFYAECAPRLPEPLGSTFGQLAVTTMAEFGAEQVAALVHTEPALTGRLGLWARRLVGEALTQAQRLAADDEPLVELVTGTPDSPGVDLAEIQSMFSRLVRQHNERMATVGLSA